MNINTKEVENCDSSLSYYKLTCIRIVLHINYDPISRGYVGFFLAFIILPPMGGFLVQFSLNSCLLFTIVSRY